MYKLGDFDCESYFPQPFLKICTLPKKKKKQRNLA